MLKSPHLFLVILITSTLPLKADKAVQIGKQKQLFVDHYIIDTLENVSIEVGQAQKIWSRHGAHLTVGFSDW